MRSVLHYEAHNSLRRNDGAIEINGSVFHSMSIVENLRESLSFTDNNSQFFLDLIFKRITSKHLQFRVLLQLLILQ